MDISHLSQSASQQGVYSNGSARIVRETRIDAGVQISEVPSVVYHGAKDNPLNTGGHVIDKIYKMPQESHEATNARLDEMMVALSTGVATASAGLKRTYEMAMESLLPDLQEKDWGFSVSNGSLVISEGSDALSTEDRATLKDALSIADVEYQANQVASTMIRALELDRGPAGVSNGIGRFDVSQGNFGDIVDLRSYLQVHEPGGSYDLNPIDPTDYERHFPYGGRALLDQISANAPIGYAKPADFGLISL
mgnify:CR=1 FL=1